MLSVKGLPNFIYYMTIFYAFIGKYALTFRLSALLLKSAKVWVKYVAHDAAYHQQSPQLQTYAQLYCQSHFLSMPSEHTASNTIDRIVECFFLCNSQPKSIQR